MLVRAHLRATPYSSLGTHGQWVVRFISGGSWRTEVYSLQRLDYPSCRSGGSDPTGRIPKGEKKPLSVDLSLQEGFIFQAMLWERPSNLCAT